MNYEMEPIQGQFHGKWFNSPVVRYRGVTTSIGDYIPDFERRAFSLYGPDARLTHIHPNLDMIVRRPHRDDPHPVPIGVVSKDYRLIPHREVLRVALEALRENDIDPSGITAHLALTQYGERMALGIFLPGRYRFDPGDGHELAMRLEFQNSVEASTRFKVFIGWFRFVCSNGLVIAIKKASYERRHEAGLSIDDIKEVLESGLSNFEGGKEQFGTWSARPVTPLGIAAWIDGDVRRAWGFKAAARAYHIARSGFDAQITGPYKDERPTTVRTKPAKRVPGAPDQISNAYDVSQVLAWLAKERNDLQEQLEWREQIPGLMNRLLG